MKEFLEWFGVNSAVTAVAGFCGGVVHIFWFKKTEYFDAVGAIVCGVLTSIWVSPYMASHTGLPEGLIGFSIGLGGVQGLAPIFAMFREKVFGKAVEKPNVP